MRGSIPFRVIPVNGPLMHDISDARYIEGSEASHPTEALVVDSCEIATHLKAFQIGERVQLVVFFCSIVGVGQTGYIE